MKKQTLFSIYLINLSVLWVCSGLLPLLPIYAGKLGASAAMTGNYMALAFVGTALGTLAAGWMSSRWHRRREMVIIAGLLCAPATWLMGQSTTIWQLSLWTTVVWTLAGVTLALVSIVAGLTAEREERGRVFGLLGLTSALASVLGGLMTGPIADRWGYGVLLTILALFWLAQVGGGILLHESRRRGATTAESAVSMRPHTALWPLFLLLASGFLISTARFLASMGQSWAMDANGFPAAAVTMVAAVGAGAGLLLNPTVGRLSDGFSRQWVLAITYAGAAFALALMANATTLVHFVMVAVLMSVAYASDVVAPALVTDLVHQDQLDRWMSYFTTARWIGAIVGYAGSGYAVQTVGLQATLIAGIALPVLAVALLFWMRRPVVETFTPVILGSEAVAVD